MTAQTSAAAAVRDLTRDPRVVIVTDLEQRAALAAARSLGRAGFRVIGVSAVPHAVARRSRFVARFIVAPDVRVSASAFAAFVAALAQREHAAAILPVSEASHLALHHLPDPTPCPVAAASAQAFANAADKALTRQLASTCGIRVPQQVIVTQGATTDLAAIPLPCAIKPSRSVPTDGSERAPDNVLYADTPAHAAAAIARFPVSSMPLLVQERVTGRGFGVSILRWHGTLLAVSAHRRVREKPVSGGVSVVSETVEAPTALIDRCLALLDALGYDSGFAMIEFKGESLDDPAFMEINPRIWGSVQLAIDAGVDMPALFVGAVLGAPASVVHRSRAGVRLRWFWGNVDHWLARVRRGLDERGVPRPGGRGAALRALLFGPTLEAVEEVGRPDDWRPVVAESWNWIRRR